MQSVNESFLVDFSTETKGEIRIVTLENDIQEAPCLSDLAIYSTFHGYRIHKTYDGEQIKEGLRVIRPQSCTPKEENKFRDGQELGTIAKVTEKGDVHVQWDTGGTDVFEKGINNNYQLLLFDNAQIGVKHIYFKCNECSQYPLRGIRWTCITCTDYNMCTDCYMASEHDLSHPFQRILSTNSKRVHMQPRENLDVTRATGIHLNSVVQLRSNPKQKGQVQQFLEKKIETFRSDAKVKWNDDSEERYSVSRHGQCDLKFTTASKGHTYYKDQLAIVNCENVEKGIRVVRGPGWDKKNVDDGGPDYMGTVTNIENKTRKECTVSRDKSSKDTRISEKRKSNVLTKQELHNVTVQWDNGKIRTYDLSDQNLRLFDNGPSGVEHPDYVCKTCPAGNTNIRGIRWKCTECEYFDLCNMCYMSDKHDLNHKFQRILAIDESEQIVDPREDSKSHIRQSYGIFEGAKVEEVKKNSEKKEGTVIEICDCIIDTGRGDVEVVWNDGRTTSHPILELKYDDGDAICYYNDNLPILGNDSRGFCEVEFDFPCGSIKKIQVDIWRNIQQERKLTFKPSLYLIFSDHPEVDAKDEKDENDDKASLMGEVIEFAKRTKLPCHVVGQKVLFHSGSTYSAFIHYNTGKDTVKKLVNRGFRRFGRGDVCLIDEDEINYFIRMAEHVMGETVLPVIISLRNGGLTTRVLKSTASQQIPIVKFKKHCLDVSILTPENNENQGATSVEMTEYRSDIKNPWSAKKLKRRQYDVGKYDQKDDPEEIALISEIPRIERESLEFLFCYLIIGVSMEEESIKKKIYGVYTDVYPNALSMYLLKEGQWRIPKEHVKRSFSFRSIEYIYEEDMTIQIKKGLWHNLTSITQKAYTTPDYQEEDSEDENATKTPQKYSKEDNAASKSAMISLMDMTKQKIRGRRIKLNVSVSELYGLIFFALLQKQYWDGARQLIETGCVGIHHILIGCVIIDDEADNWRTTPSTKERLQRLKNAFTKRAIRITSSIYDADKKKEDADTERKENKLKIYKDDPEKQEERELGDHVNHAGRLLLNHGYIENAVMTKNKTFLDNSTVKGALNKMWYGTEQIDFRTIVCFIVLAAVHMVLLPLLAMNMEYRPLRWFYKKYKLPFMKVFLNMLGFFALLIAYAYMLLFDYSDGGITSTDYFILAWMVSFFIDETKQQIIAIVRGKWKSYVNDWWNRLDWLSMMVYTSGMILKLDERYHFRTASTVLLVTAFILLCIRVLNLCCISSILGPKLVMIRKMFEDTAAFLIIMAVIMMCYNVSFYALLYPNSQFSWGQLEKITRNGYWMLFGELNLDADTLKEPECTFNKTIYGSDILQRCPSTIGVHLTPYLKAVYGLIAVILLLNLLIAMYSHTFGEVQQESEFYWSQLQTEFLKKYSIKTVFPIHLQFCVIPATIIHTIIWACRILRKRCCGLDRNLGSSSNHKDDFGMKATLNHRPMFVRVFLYNTNFDLKLKTTTEAEGNGALKAKGEIDCIEDDRIAMIHKQLDASIKAQEKQNQKMQHTEQLDTNIRAQAMAIQKIMSTLGAMEKRLDSIEINIKLNNIAKQTVTEKVTTGPLKGVTEKVTEEDGEFDNLDEVSILESATSSLSQSLSEEETANPSNYVKSPSDDLVSSEDEYVSTKS